MKTLLFSLPHSLQVAWEDNVAVCLIPSSSLQQLIGWIASSPDATRSPSRNRPLVPHQSQPLAPHQSRSLAPHQSRSLAPQHQRMQKTNLQLLGLVLRPLLKPRWRLPNEVGEDHRIRGTLRIGNIGHYGTCWLPRGQDRAYCLSLFALYSLCSTECHQFVSSLTLSN